MDLGGLGVRGFQEIGFFPCCDSLSYGDLEESRSRRETLARAGPRAYAQGHVCEYI